MEGLSLTPRDPPEQREALEPGGKGSEPNQAPITAKEAACLPDSGRFPKIPFASHTNGIGGGSHSC